VINDTVSRIIWEWGCRCFGEEHMLDRKARALRLVEEAIELAQAMEVPEQQIQKLTSVVYKRPVGEPAREIGGVFVTAILMSQCLGWQPQTMIELEVCRCLAKSPEDFAKRNAEKNALGLTGR
jgi:hypothetical protein